MTSIDLSTSYLRLKLARPFMTGASPLGDHLDTVRQLEDAGCAAIVLHSLFEEQISEPRRAGRDGADQCPARGERLGTAQTLPRRTL
jgi:hypothetical protein